jgi:hypothetical protein
MMIEPTPLLRSTGAQADAYVARLLAALRGARLNSAFPDARALMAHIEPLASSVHGGLYGELEVHATSGLPSYREWTRVQTDVQLAAEQLGQLGARAQLEQKVRAGKDAIFAKQLAKHDYYSKLLDRELAPLGAMKVALRRVDAAQQRAWFHVVLDKLDVSGVFVRYAIDLSQRSSAWSKPVVTLDAEHARHTEAFQALIYQFTSLGSVFTWAKLVTIQGLELERVSRGVVGPIFLTAEQAPEPMRGLWSADPGAMIATFSQDIIAGDIAQAQDNDPLSGLLTDPIPAEARATFDAARERAGVKHYLDRKFVVPRALVAATQTFCTARGTRNIVYGV